MTSYYNEHDPKAAQWLRNLIAAGHIAPGIVDERSIEDVAPDDLREFTQCHFFAGIGVWSYALRRAGWPDDRPAWSGSCPCQPFSAAGKGAGFVDERHLWPAFHYLIEKRRPAIVFGEQVASADGLAWFDLVHADLEGSGYTVGAADLCAAGYGAPHIRQRLWFVGVDHAQREGLERHAGHDRAEGRQGPFGPATEAGFSGWLADTNSDGRSSWDAGSQTVGHGQAAGADSGIDANSGTSPTNGHWRNADWLRCRDEKWRPVEPGTSPLVDGAAARVVRLRAYGNAICAPVAQAFIEAVMDGLGVAQ